MLAVANCLLGTGPCEEGAAGEDAGSSEVAEGDEPTEEVAEE